MGQVASTKIFYIDRPKYHEARSSKVERKPIHYEEESVMVGVNKFLVETPMRERKATRR